MTEFDRVWLKPSGLIVIGPLTDPESLAAHIWRRNQDLLPLAGVVPHGDGNGYPASVGQLAMVYPLAVMTCSRSDWRDALVDCGYHGVKAVIILDDGLDQTPIHPQLQQQLAEIAAQYQIELLGPDSDGWITPPLNLSTIAVPVSEGQIAIITESGSLAATLLDWAEHHQVGWSWSVSPSKSGFDLARSLQLASVDPQTRAVAIAGSALWLQAAANLLPILRSLTASKPVVALWPALSDNDLRLAFIRQSGMIRTSTLEDFLLLAQSFSLQPQGNVTPSKLGVSNSPTLLQATAPSLRLAIVTPQAVEEGFELQQAELPTKGYEMALSRLLPEAANTLLAVITPEAGLNPIRVARFLAQYAQHSHCRVAAVLLSSDRRQETVAYLAEHNIQVFDFPETALRILDLSYQASHPHSTSISRLAVELRAPVAKIVNGLSAKTAGPHLDRLWRLLHLPHLSYHPIATVTKAESVAKQLGWPLRFIAEDQPRVIVTTTAGLRQQIRHLKPGQSAWLQEIRREGIELDLTITTNDTFGMVMTMAWRGGYAALAAPVSCLLPASRSDLKFAWQQLQVTPVIEQLYANSSVHSYIDFLECLSQLVAEGGVARLELPELVVTSKEIIITSARLDHTNKDKLF